MLVYSLNLLLSFFEYYYESLRILPQISGGANLAFSEENPLPLILTRQHTYTITSDHVLKVRLCYK